MQQDTKGAGATPTKIAAASEVLHLFLHLIPEALWDITSLAEHLHKCRSSENGQPEPEEAQEEAEDAAELIASALPADDKAPQASTEGRAFFRAVDAEDQEAFTIGVADKCCPVCKMLIDLLRTEHQLELHISGAHSRFHPWVPPQWLPDDVMRELEKRLVAIVQSMVLEQTHLHGSRASSPASDSDLDMDLLFVMHTRIAKK
ncbi:hypothetical protein B0H12DRAFT_1230747 [Mycena haematopus]|nr:hypothetical protein B0H12DRAFT_1230747 [Mycena haematopus]